MMLIYDSNSITACPLGQQLKITTAHALQALQPTAHTSCALIPTGTAQCTCALSFIAYCACVLTLQPTLRTRHGFFSVLHMRHGLYSLLRMRHGLSPHLAYWSPPWQTMARPSRWFSKKINNNPNIRMKVEACNEKKTVVAQGQGQHIRFPPYPTTLNLRVIIK